MPYTKDKLASACASDKKARGDTINLIIPYGIGDCRIYPVLLKDLEDFLT
jgi:3-dehydroquinate synthetase